MLRNLLKDQNPTQFRISDLLKTKNKPATQSSKNRISGASSVQKDIKITSPFYPRNQCHKGGGCKCPFHPMKRTLAIPEIIKSKRNFPQSLHTRKQNRRQLVTEGSNKIEIAIHRPNKRKKTEIVVGQNVLYDQVGCRVECRNNSFEQFLKEKELYILTGKLPTQEAVREKEIFQQLQGYIFSELKNRGNQLDSEDSELNLNFERKLSRYHTTLRDKNQMPGMNRLKPKKLDPRQNIKRNMDDCDKFRVLLDLVSSGKKNLSIIEMKLYRDHIKKLILQKSNKDQYHKSLPKLNDLLGRIDVMIKKMQDTEKKKKSMVGEECLSSKKSFGSQKQSSFRDCSNSNCSSKKQSAKKQKRVSIFDPKHKEKKSAVLHNLGKRRNSRFQEGESGQYESSDQDEENYSEQKDQMESVKELSNEQLQTMDLRKKASFANQVSGTVKKTKLRPKLQNSYLGRMKSMVDGQDKQLQGFGGDSKFVQSILLNIDLDANKNGRNQNLKGLMNSRTEPDEAQCNNFERLRRLVHRNRNFILRIRRKLQKLDLGEFIIHQTDSLITQKKKIRYLSQMIPNQKSKLSTQLSRYLELHSEHCSRILRQPAARRQANKTNLNKLKEQIALEKQEFVANDLFNNRDLNKSLKFIDLSKQDSEQQKDIKAVGWIAISQFTSHDQKRLSKMGKILHKMNLVKSDSPKKRSSCSQRSDDSLVQTNMEQRFEIISPPPQAIPIITDKITPKDHIDPFETKLKEYRRVLQRKRNNSSQIVSMIS